MNVSAADICFWGLDSPTTHQAIGLCCTLSGPLDVEALRARIEASISIFPKLLQCRLPKPAVGWKECSELEYSYHIQHRLLETSGEPSVELHAAAEAAFSEPLLTEHPLWQFHYIEHHATSESILLYRIHHSIADGLSGMALFFSLCDSSSTPSTEPNSEALRSYRRGSSWKEQNLWSSLKKCLSDILSRPNTHSLKSTNTAARNLHFLAIDIAATKSFRSKNQIGLNELYLSAVTRGLQYYFTRIQEPIPPWTALLPVNLRSSQDITELGNHLTATRIRLPVELESISDITRSIAKELERIQTDGSFGAYKLASECLARLPHCLRTPLLRFAAARIDSICTNAPGPKRTRWIAGAEITEVWGIPALMYSQGLGFAAVRYREYLHLCCVCTASRSDACALVLQGISEFIRGVYEDGVRLDTDQLSLQVDSRY